VRDARRGNVVPFGFLEVGDWGGVIVDSIVLWFVLNESPNDFSFPFLPGELAQLPLCDWEESLGVRGGVKAPAMSVLMLSGGLADRGFRFLADCSGSFDVRQIENPTLLRTTPLFASFLVPSFVFFFAKEK
jgi:hypothetical protein